MKKFVKIVLKHTMNTEKCTRPDQTRFVNCYENRSSLSKTCPTFIKNNLIQRMAIIDNVPYILTINKDNQSNVFQD